MATLLKIKKQGELTPEYIIENIEQSPSWDGAKALYLLTLT